MTMTERLRKYIKYHDLHIQYRKEHAAYAEQSSFSRDEFGYAWWAALFTKAGPGECAEIYAYGHTVEAAIENLLNKLDVKHANN